MSVNLNTLKDIRNLFISGLKGIYPESEITAITNLIFKTQLGIDRLHLFLDPGTTIAPENLASICEILNELRTGKPVQYVLGETIFYNCTIKVDNNTLIPRPETEELVDLVIKENPAFKGRITDFGTGSGCIAVAVKKYLPEAEVKGIDISEGAIAKAIENAVLNNVMVTFVKGDILHFNMQPALNSEIVISNPPYVLESEKQFMKNNILDFEPHNALFVPDEDPLLFYRAIINISEEILMPGGRIYFEINETKGGEMNKLLELHKYSEIRIVRDINGKNRIITGRKNG
jgi:release factor glutamine methyltransferase